MSGTQRKPKWMQTWRYFVADVLVPAIGVSSLVEQLLRDSFDLTKGLLAAALATGGPALTRAFDAVLGGKK